MVHAMSDNACETSLHHDMSDHVITPANTDDEHLLCGQCGRCYTCAAKQTRDAGDALARRVNEWERDNPKAYGRIDGT